MSYEFYIDGYFTQIWKVILSLVKKILTVAVVVISALTKRMKKILFLVYLSPSKNYIAFENFH